jgi:hypothetical protein
VLQYATIVVTSRVCVQVGTAAVDVFVFADYTEIRTTASCCSQRPVTMIADDGADDALAILFWTRQRHGTCSTPTRLTVDFTLSQLRLSHCFDHILKNLPPHCQRHIGDMLVHARVSVLNLSVLSISIWYFKVTLFTPAISVAVFTRAFIMVWVACGAVLPPDEPASKLPRWNDYVTYHVVCVAWNSEVW